MSFCPRCGKPAKNKFCQDCLREHYPLVESIKRVELTMCPSCSRTYTKNVWGKKQLQDVLEHQLERAISFNQGVRVEGVIVEPIDPQPGKQTIQLTVMGTGDIDAEEIYDEFYEVDLLIHGQLCTECQRLQNQYFTGIIQLRRPNETVQYEIERLLGRALTDAKDVTGGIDYYVSEHRILQNVARAAHSKFGGELTIRAQHFSYDNLTSKNLYRVNACLRLPKYWTGSVLQAGSKIFRVITMGRLLKGIDLETGQRTSVPFHIDYPEYPLLAATIVATRPQLTILDPETYQTVAIMNQLPLWDAYQPGTKVVVVETPKGFLLVGEAEESIEQEEGDEEKHEEVQPKTRGRSKQKGKDRKR